VIAASSAYGTQSLTLAIPLGFFIVMVIVGFFQRNHSK
jgi:hypothetical protein